MHIIIIESTCIEFFFRFSLMILCCSVVLISVLVAYLYYFYADSIRTFIVMFENTIPILFKHYCERSREKYKLKKLIISKFNIQIVYWVPYLLSVKILYFTKIFLNFKQNPFIQCLLKFKYRFKMYK